MGKRAPGSGVVTTTDTLRENVNEDRIVGADLSAPTTPGSATIRKINVQLRGLYAGAPVDTSISQEVIQTFLTDTLDTRFGSGWQLAELSRLIFGQTYQAAPAAIWLSGDGSFTVLRQVGGVWVSPPGESARLLDSLTTSGLGARFVISLPSGATIGYYANGWQQWTADLVGNRTNYVYQSGRLIQILDPSGLRYNFRYNPAGPLGQVTDIVMQTTAGDTAKIATLEYNAAKRLRSIKIWRSTTQSDSAKFGYVTATAYGAYVDSIVDPRSNAGTPIITTVTYDSLFATATTIRRPPDANDPSGAVATLWDPWRRALPRLGRGVLTPEPLERLVFASQHRGTSQGFTLPPVDFTVDPFGGPTFVRRIAAASATNGDDVRRIARDSLGRVLRIVQAPDSAAIADSVMYRYDSYNRVDRIIRNTLAFPVPANTPLDTITFTYDSVTLSGGVVRCHRLRSMKDAMGGVTRVNYDSLGAGVRPCLPIRAIGLASDTTKFTYGALTVGNPAATRPVSVVDPNNLSESATYDPATWNTATHVRQGDGATTSGFYDLFGRIDHVIDPVSTRTDFRYDVSGRLLRTKTGTGLTAPTTATFYNPADLVDSVRVYASADVDASPSGTVQRTRYTYNRLGFSDTTITPGARKIASQLDRLGNPFQVYPGNATLITRIYDWQGRLTSETPGQVDPNQSQFADARDDSVYKSFGLSFTSRTLSPGQSHSVAYDNKGRPIYSKSQEALQTDSIIVHRRGFNRVNALIADTITFMDGLRVIRSLEYNRRGQRTLARDTIVALGTGTIQGEKGGTLRYYYNSSTARMDSLVGQSGTVKIGKIRWLYDRGGRDSIRVLRLGSGSGYATDSLLTKFTYDAAGRLSKLATTRGTTTWFQFDATGAGSYNSIDDLNSFSNTEPPAGAGGLVQTYGYGFTYASNGTRRLMGSNKTLSGVSQYSYTWTYDVFGNRITESPFSAFSPPCEESTLSTSYFGGDNQLTMRDIPSCVKKSLYWNDHAGNRLAQTDSSSHNYQPPPRSILAYTAKNELIYSTTPTVQVGTYDYNWHWYDGSGLRVVSQVQSGNGFLPSGPSGPRTYYVYDGAELVLVLVGPGSFWMRQRFLSDGTDAPLAGRFATNGSSAAQNLALITDRQGTTMAGLKNDWTQESQTVYYSKNPFGVLEFNGSSGSVGGTNTETGYTGASTPNQTGGLVYLRSRWYDPKTGRFLVQDPIGLDGGLNLYEYAGSNPVDFIDPFGLCQMADTGRDYYYNPCGETIFSRPNGLDSDRFYLVANGIVREMKYVLDAIIARPADDRDFLQKTGDFVAGFGDLPFGVSDWLRSAIPGGCREDCVRYESPQYFAGQMTVLSLAAFGSGTKALGVDSRIMAHGAHHPFLGVKLPHIQFTWWFKGISGSDSHIRIPLPKLW